MWTGFAGNIDSTLPRGGDKANPCAGGHVNDMQRTTGFAGEFQSALNGVEFSALGTRVQIIANGRFARRNKFLSQLTRNTFAFGMDGDYFTEPGRAFHSFAQCALVSIRETADTAI